MTVVEYSEVAVPATEREERARLLEGAALEIEFRGWAQSTLCTSDGRVCAAGAIAAAHGGSPYEPEAYDLAHRTWFGFDSEDGVDLLKVPRINDQARTVEEVTLALRSRAAEIREGK